MNKNPKKEISLILHDIRSVHNAGAIFRTADAIGVSKIYLTGYTPAPKDRFGRDRSDFAKSALGAEKTVSWEQVKNITPLLTRLKKEKFFIVGLEQDKGAVDYKKIKPKTKNAVILGNEVLGIPKEILESCDKVAQIGMKGKKESLNVSVAAGIALYGIFDK